MYECVCSILCVRIGVFINRTKLQSHSTDWISRKECPSNRSRRYRIVFTNLRVLSKIENIFYRIYSYYRRYKIGIYL